MHWEMVEDRRYGSRCTWPWRSCLYCGHARSVAVLASLESHKWVRLNNWPTLLLRGPRPTSVLDLAASPTNNSQRNAHGMFRTTMEFGWMIDITTDVFINFTFVSAHQFNPDNPQDNDHEHCYPSNRSEPQCQSKLAIFWWLIVITLDVLIRFDLCEVHQNSSCIFVKLWMFWTAVSVKVSGSLMCDCHNYGCLHSFDLCEEHLNSFRLSRRSWALLPSCAVTSQEYKRAPDYRHGVRDREPSRESLGPWTSYLSLSLPILCFGAN